MTDSPNTRIRFLDGQRPYADGAESAVLSALDEVADRSDGSDELAGRAVDWPTLYHFSPKRGNILRPFDIPRRFRVLEIGAGTGAVTRHLGERGATVVALEGDAERAAAVARRCADLDTVEVVCGPLAGFDDPAGFDLVISVGVIEYAGSCSDGLDRQLDFLDRAGRLVRPAGAMVIAVENRLGLKYLLGFAEDHLGEAWAGVEGYPGRPAVCTVSRAELGRALASVGFGAQRWYFPFPDYKLPRVVLSEAAYDFSDATTVIDHLVGRPMVDLAHPPSRTCDDRAAHRSFLDAGLGPDIANSFLIAAARADTGLDAITDRTAVAWHFSSDRLRPLRRVQVLRREPGRGLHLTGGPIRPGASGGPAAWLGHEPEKSAPFFAGPTVEQRALEAARHRDREALARVIEAWHRKLTEAERPATGSAASPAAPFAAPPDRPSLPPEYLDVSLSNFVDAGAALEFVDREWRAATRVDARLVRYRALWYFALELVVGGSPHPFGADTGVDAIAAELGGLIGLDVTEQERLRFRHDESVLQEAVTGEAADRVEARLGALGSTSHGDRAVALTLPVTQLRRDLIELGATVDRLQLELAAHREASQAALDEAREYQQSLETELDGMRSQIDEAHEYQQNLETELDRMRSQIDEARRYQRRLETELDGARSRIGEVEAEGARLESEFDDATATAHRLAAELARLEAWRTTTVRRPLIRLALAGHRLSDRLRGRRG